MEYFSILLPLSLILLISKILSKLCTKFGLPQVVGMLLTGILIGLIRYIPGQEILTSATYSGLGFLAKIGVVLIMFSAGLETDIKQIKAVGGSAVAITMAGVIVPMALGFVVACLFNGGFNTGKEQLLQNLFYGTILTATSVSVTVATLKEMGKLKGRVGTAILGAAVIDDILGIIALTVVSSFTNPDIQIHTVLIKIVLFFVFIAVVGFFVYKYFSHLNNAFNEKMHRRVAIYGLAFCLLLSFASEQFFGVADITGAYFAGLLLCNLPSVRAYVSRKIEICAYMLFSPVFFASVGLKTDLRGLSLSLLVFAILLLLIAILSKIIGCGLSAKLFHFSNHEALSVGIGMVSRGEVALIVAQKGAAFGLVPDSLFGPVILVVIVTTLITPILLKLVMGRKPA